MKIEKINLIKNVEIRLKIIYDEKSYISGIVYINDELYINYFYVDKKNRKKGIGTKLLKKIIEISQKDYNINQVLLTDETERYRKNKNIYINNGFIYENEKNKKMKLSL